MVSFNMLLKKTLKLLLKKMHKSNLDDREINVEISTSATALIPQGKKQPTQKKPKRPRKAAKKPAQDEKAEEAAPAEEEKTGDEGADAKKSTKRKTKRRPRKAKKKPAAAAATTEKKAEPKEHSETVLYVSNIPFTLDDEALKEAFAKFNPTSANVIRRKRNNLSKGFGFVNFDKEEDQAAALAEMHKAKVGDREVTVRKAHLRPETEESGETSGEPAAEEASN